MFTHAIARAPCARLIDGLTSADLGPPAVELAIRQHRAYVDALERIGLHVTVLPAAEDYPDSVFVEDAALFTPQGVVLTRPGADSRRGEAALLHDPVAAHRRRVDVIEAPGTLDAGDVMMVGEHYYIGLSERTNAEGAAQLIAVLAAQGLTGSTIALTDGLHLKSSVSYLEHGTLLVGEPLTGQPEFARFRRIEVPPEEAYAANSLWINDTVLVPGGFPRTLAQIEAHGLRTHCLDMSEFQKMDGGLSCLSLRFSTMD
jgi:dimethylargininase